MTDNQFPTCPKCGEHEFEITVRAVAKVVFRPHGQFILMYEGVAELWYPDDVATCTHCRHTANLDDMVAPEV